MPANRRPSRRRGCTTTSSGPRWDGWTIRMGIEISFAPACRSSRTSRESERDCPQVASSVTSPTHLKPGVVLMRLCGLVACLAGSVLPLAARAQVIGENFTASNRSQATETNPDTDGAVSPDYFVEFVKGRYSVYRRGVANNADGTRMPVQFSSLGQFWNNAGVSWQGRVTDPRILYDSASQRWFAAGIDNPF